jgi:hypothetical protein
VLFPFGSVRGSGGHPTGGVILDSAGDIFGGAAEIVYKLDPAGQFTAIGDLGSKDAGLSTLARDASGNFYFTANEDNGQGIWPNGAVLKVDPSGTITGLYQFTGAVVSPSLSLPVAPGKGLTAGVALDSSGNLYGTTPFQGTAGIAYEIEAGGKVESLYDFRPYYGGSEPSSGLTLDAGSF